MSNSTDIELELRIITAAREWFDDDEAVRRVSLEGEPCPTACPEGCEVEPDGYCPHNYPSHWLVMMRDA